PSGELLDRDPGPETDLEHAVGRLDVEEPGRPEVALPVRPPVRHDPAGGATAEAVGPMELADHGADRLLLESHAPIPQVQVRSKSSHGGRTPDDRRTV